MRAISTYKKQGRDEGHPALQDTFDSMLGLPGVLPVVGDVELVGVWRPFRVVVVADILHIDLIL